MIPDNFSARIQYDQKLGGTVITVGDGIATAYFSTTSSDTVSIQVNGAERINYYSKRPFIMMIGNVKQGDTITLHSTFKDSSGGSFTAYCTMFNDTLFEQGYNKLSQSTLRATTVGDTKLYGDINAVEDGLFYTSISYATGWKAYVDGVETEITPVGNALLAFKVSQGEHHIELRYTPEGFVTGVICSTFALLIFIAMCIVIPKRRKLFAKVYQKFGIKEEEQA